jgi:hypothetical protein
LRSISSDGISVMELPISLTGVSIRVALTTIPSVSASEFESADEVASCARQMKGAAERTAAARSHERFRITSYLKLSRGRLDPAIAGRRVHSSHSSFSRRSFSEPLRCRESAINDRGYNAGSNEVETGKYSGSWLLKKLRVLG